MPASASFRTALAALMLTATPAFAEERTRPITFGGAYTADSFANVRGGLGTGFRYMSLLELSAEVDGKAFGADGAQGFASVQHVHGESLSGDLVGDAQVVSNIDAPDGLRLFEAWMSIPVAGRGYVKGGLIDLNGEFDVQTVGALFLNSSHGIGPDFSQSGLNGPSIFPTTSTAVIGGWAGGGWSARIGLFDAVAGDPDRPRRTIVRLPGKSGLLLVAEADLKIAEAAELQLGVWRYTSKFDPHISNDNGATRKRRGNRGAYTAVEGELGKVADQPVSAWVRTGVAATEFNAIGLYVGGGLGIGEENSRFGLGIAHARLGRPALRGTNADRAETIVELTYARAIGDRVIVQPDIQYVINPSWDPGLRNALVAGVRIQLELF